MSKNTYFAMVVTRCFVGGKITDSIDVSARVVAAESEAMARTAIENSPSHSYQNPDGEVVTWELTRIMSVDESHGLEPGDDVTGFVIQRGDLSELTDHSC